MTAKELDFIYTILIEYGVAEDMELQLVTTINGYSKSTLLDVLYARTGLRTLDQLLAEEDLEDYKKIIEEGA